MGAPSFEMTIDWDERNSIMHVQGELDYATAPVLEDALKNVISSGAENITLDFQGVSFLDSEGLKVLLRAYRYLRDRGGSMRVQGCSRFVARTFEILGLESHFGICHEDESD